MSKKMDKTQIDLIKESGIPIKKIVFLKTVTAWSGDPETAFYSDHNPRSARLANIWYTPHTVLIEQKNGYQVLVPSSLIQFMNPL